MSSKNAGSPDQYDATGEGHADRVLLSIPETVAAVVPFAGRVLVAGHLSESSVALAFATRIATIHGAKLESVPTEALAASTPDLVVLERQHRLTAGLPGSLQHKLLARVSGPVLLVPHGAHLPDDPPLFRSLLCAVEFCDSLGPALTFAGSFGGRAERITVLHVVSDDFPGEYSHGRYHFAPNQLVSHLETEALQTLERLVGRPDERFALTVVVGKRARDIHDMAKRLNPDLLVVAGPFDSGTLHHVASQTACPMLCVPQLLPA